MVKKLLLCIVGIIILLGFVLGIIDYKRIKKHELPLFMIRVTKDNDDIQKYFGLGYKLKRYVNVSFREPMYLDDEIKFGLWIFTWRINIFTTIMYVYNIETTETPNCNRESKLYYTDENKKIYTYCLDSITTSAKKDFKDHIKNNVIKIDDFIEGLIFVEENKDKGYKIYRDTGKTKNISHGYTNNGLTVINCREKNNSSDIYIGPKWMEYEEDFCN